MDIRNCDAEALLDSLDDNSVDLILTDPPYIISKDSGMDKLAKRVAGGDSGPIRTENQWEDFKKKHSSREYNEQDKANFLQWGHPTGKKFAVNTDYGDWDSQFTMEKLEEVLKKAYTKLRKGGTIIVWFDLWKLTLLYEMMDRCKFKQPRFIEWIKTNPQPLNSKRNYLTNCREIALLGVKGGTPTFNSEYDNSVYTYPLMGGKYRKHPTQKSLELFKDIIKKHSNEGDLVCDLFLGAGTTARAAKETNRKFVGSELNENFYKIATDWASLASS